MTPTLPILYSFRRCPYAMRARMAIHVSEQTVRLREVVLREKPAAMLAISPKGTVPVLQLTDGTVIDESLAIMDWALARHDPENWRGPAENQSTIMTLINRCETNFKGHLDRYKYPSRYDNVDPTVERAKALSFVNDLSKQLAGKPFLFGPSKGMADIAIFPFVRQFANTDRDWFDGLGEIAPARLWLDRCLNLPVFSAVMNKEPQWHEGDEPTIFPRREGRSWDGIVF